MARIRVLIVDDHAIVRAGLRMLINPQPDMEVVGEAGDGEERGERRHGRASDRHEVNSFQFRHGPSQEVGIAGKSAGFWNFRRSTRV